MTNGNVPRLGHERGIAVAESKIAGETAAKPHREYRYYDLVMVGFVVVLVCSNLIGPAKAAELNLPWWGPFTFGAGVMFFPISYVFGDIMTEVYGFARARRIIWAGFAAMIFASIMAAVVVALPPSPNWPNQKAYEIAFGNTWRIAAASMVAFWCGEFFNSFIIAKMKLGAEGKQTGARIVVAIAGIAVAALAYTQSAPMIILCGALLVVTSFLPAMALRFVASTLAAEIVDSALFYPLAFYGSGIMPDSLVLQLVWAQAGLKTLVEIVFLPVTYWIVKALKRAENEDYYDRGTSFTPFSMKT